MAMPKRDEMLTLWGQAPRNRCKIGLCASAGVWGRAPRTSSENTVIWPENAAVILVLLRNLWGSNLPFPIGHQAFGQFLP